MQGDRFTALVVDQVDGDVRAGIRELGRNELPDGDVMVSVAYSSLNYKDGLAVNGKARVVRRYPMVPGIDLAGTVLQSNHPDWQPGDRVIATGWGLGENHWGGYSQLERVQGDWLVSLPPGLDLDQAMGLGSAGFTAMLCLMALQDAGVAPESGDVVVTGAAGGVGSVAVALLAEQGYRVVASTGRAEEHGYLTELGAKEIIDRNVLSQPSDRPLESGRWAGAVDNVGGDTLAGLLRTMAKDGAVAACGNAGGNQLTTTVLPFILRGVRLLGIDSNYCPRERRVTAWDRLAREMPLEKLKRIVHHAPLQDVPALSRDILQGGVRGRTVIDISGPEALS